MKLMVYAHENGSIPQTKSGAFNRKFVNWAAVEFDWKDYTAEQIYRINKVLNEDDFLPLMVMHDLLWVAKIGRHFKGQFVLTPKGRKLIGKHGELQQLLFQTLLYDYNLGNLDRLHDDDHPDWDIIRRTGRRPVVAGAWRRAWRPGSDGVSAGGLSVSTPVMQR